MKHRLKKLKRIEYRIRGSQDEKKPLSVNRLQRNITSNKTILEYLKDQEDSLKVQNNLFSSLLKVLPIGVFMVEAGSGKPLIANEAAKELLGRGILPDATKDNLGEIYQAYKYGTHETYPPEEMPIIRGMKGIDSHIDDLIVKRPDGTERLLEIFGSSVKDPDGNTWASLVSFKDITERKELEQRIEREKKLFHATLVSVGDGVISSDINGIVQFMNPVAEKLTGWTQEEACGRPFEEIFQIMNERTGEKIENITKLVFQTGCVVCLAENTVLVSRTGEKRPIEDTASPIIMENGEAIGVVVVFSDFTEKRKKIEEIEYLSYHDFLTGLYNRRYFDEELKRYDVKRNLPISIIMADVNGLKLVNDSFGHAIGDEILIKASTLISKVCRADDVVCRLGGDEFAVLLPGTDANDTAGLIKRIQEKLIEEEIGGIPLSISFGFATKENQDESMIEKIKNAEDHMYRHKLYESTGARSKTVNLIINTLYAKNHREMLHSLRVGELSASTATAMGFSPDDVNQIRTAGLMHDIGKIGIEDNILNKAEKLNKQEWDEIKKHSEIGYHILSSVPEFSEIADFVLEHQERWDGKGYPRGLSGTEISVEARIIAISDSFDAMTGERTYGRILSEEEAIQELLRCSGTQFDPEIVDIFIKNISEKRDVKVGEKYEKN